MGKHERGYARVDRETRIVDTHLSARARNALLKDGIKNVGQLCRLTEYQLRWLLIRLPGAGQVTEREIYEFIDGLPKAFRPIEEDPPDDLYYRVEFEGDYLWSFGLREENKAAWCAIDIAYHERKPARLLRWSGSPSVGDNGWIEVIEYTPELADRNYQSLKDFYG